MLEQVAILRLESVSVNLSSIGERWPPGILRKFAQFSKMWMACYTQDEIAEAVGVEKMTVSRKVELCNNLEALPKSYKLSALHETADFKPPGVRGTPENRQPFLDYAKNRFQL